MPTAAPPQPVSLESKNESRNGGAHKPANKQEKPAKAPLLQEPLIRRTLACPCGGGCPECQRKQAQGIGIQAKLKIGAPNDKYEQEADRIADQVMRMPLAESSLGNSTTGVVQRKCSGCAENSEEEKEDDLIQTKSLDNQAAQSIFKTLTPLVQTKVTGNTGATEVGSDVASGISSLQGGGRPMSQRERSFFEPRFGADFSSVRIHEGSRAGELAHGINARAFTTGNDIFFGAGQYSPSVSGGQRLMAHELAHTIQQGGVAGPSVQREGENWLERGVNFVTSSAERGIEWAKERMAEFARELPGYSLLCVILARDPITGAHVERNGRNFIEAGLDIIPFGDLLRDKMVQMELLEEAAEWLDRRMSQANVSVDAIMDEISRFIHGLEFTLDPTPQIEAGLDIIRRPIGEVTSFAEDTGVYFLSIIKRVARQEISDFVRAQGENISSFRAYPLMTVILGEDPITGEEVERNGMNLVRGFVLLSENGEEELAQMEERGTLQETADWVDGAINTLQEGLTGLQNAFSEAWKLLTIESLMEPTETFRQLIEIFAAPVRTIFDFVVEVSKKILEFIKNALLGWLSDYAHETRGYPLVTVLLGKDPFTEEVVERNPENIIHGFMSLMEGGEEKFQQMKETGAIDQTVEWLENAVAHLNMTWEYITGIFRAAWEALSIVALSNPVDAFVEIVSLFAPPVERLVVFAWEVLKKLVEIVLTIMGFPFDLIGNIISKAMQAIEDIKRDPIGFFLNIIAAIKEGFSRFFDNILTHLIGGLADWLFGEVAEAGITPPRDLSLGSIFGFILDVLGFSLDRLMERIWEKLAERIGPERVAQMRGMIDRLVGIWSFIQDVLTRGPIAIWEYIAERLSNLWDMVLEKVQEWIMERVINAAMQRVLSLLDPTGIMAVINSAIAIYNAVESFFRYLREMLEIVNSFVEGVAEIAQGQIDTAATFIENALARAVPIAIGFLANQVGLGGIGRRVSDMIEAVQDRFDMAVDWLLDRALDAGTSFLNSLGLRSGDEDEAEAERQRLDSMGIEAVLAMPPTPEPRNAEQKQQDLDDAVDLLKRIAHNEDEASDIGSYFDRIKNRFGLVDIGYRDIGEPSARIEVSINPRNHVPSSELGDIKLNTEGLQEAASNMRNEITLSGAIILGPGPVATKMEATQLGPNHPRGSETRSGHSIPEVMDELPSASGSTPDGYVAGHLLNYDLGGPGDDPRNLFPITGYANNRHYNDVERHVKEWVNERHYWVYYSVEVDNIDDKGPDFSGPGASNSVDATFKCKAYPLKLDGSGDAAGEGFERTIPSTYRERQGARDERDTDETLGVGSAQSDEDFRAAGGVPQTVTRRNRSGGANAIVIRDQNKAQLIALGMSDELAESIHNKNQSDNPIRRYSEIVNLPGFVQSEWDKVLEKHNIVLYRRS